jgi:hypothetical protein
MDTAKKETKMLSPLKIGQKFYVPRAAQMHGRDEYATVTANPSAGVYVLTYADGFSETLTDSE